jgi:murein DD-endopeptidase MepM/ murein hydrolase activator NlpD
VTRAARRLAASCLAAAALAACGPARERDSVAALLASRRLMVPVAAVRPSDVPNGFDDPRDGGARRHQALDIFAPRGTPVVAADDGVVLSVGTSRHGGRSVYAVDPDRRLVYYYAHLERYRPGLRAGTSVTRGDVLGFVGASGNATAPHLHFQVRLWPEDGRWWAGTPVDPRPFLVVPGTAAAARGL